MAASGVGGGVGVRAGKRGAGLCTIKAPSVLLGVKGMIMHTNGSTGGWQGEAYENGKKNKREKKQ